MTSERTVFSSNMSLKKPASVVYTVDNSKLNISHIGDISIASLSLSNAFLVLQLLYWWVNYVSLDLYVFSYRGCVVQDP